MDPFADAWPVIEGWLIAEPAVSAKVLMERLATLVPDAYAGKRCVVIGSEFARLAR